MSFHNSSMTLRALTGAALATALLAAAPATSSAASAVAAPPTPPSQGTWLGAHVNPRYGADQLTSIHRFESDIGRKLQVANKYHGFSDHSYKVEAALIASGQVPLISWRATDSANDGKRAAKIAAGTYDGVIADTADAVKALGGGVLIRFAWEMDQPQGSRQYIGSPADFVAAWRHVVSIFRAHGATNAAFVWAPRAAAWKKNVATSFYPGASYVDWIGSSAVPVGSWPTFSDTFAPFYTWASAQSKPLLTWVGVREDPSSPQWKANWMTATAQTISQQMPDIKAFVYYHALSPLGYAFWADTTGQSMTAYKTLACSAYFDAGTYC
jgi:hypothetical protein